MKALAVVLGLAVALAACERPVAAPAPAVPVAPATLQGGVIV